MNMNFTDQARDIFIVGLRNAHAMENQALSIMKPQASRIESYPQVLERLQRHIAETEGQIQRLDTILQGMGESSSAFKDTAQSFMGSMAAMGHTVAGDEIIKNSLANFAFENYEIAAYTSLMTLAEAGGFAEAESLLRQNLDEERAMARWLEDNLPAVTLQYVDLRAAGANAKV